MAPGTVGGDEAYYLNMAQNLGLISDHCVTAADVADVDAAPAIRRMLGNHPIARDLLADNDPVGRVTLCAPPSKPKNDQPPKTPNTH